MPKERWRPRGPARPAGAATSRAGSSTACRCRSRTSCSPGACRRSMARAPSAPTSPGRTTLPRSRDCASTGRSSWARPPPRSSGTSSSRTARSPASPATRGTSSAAPEEAAAAPRPRWRRGSVRWRSGPTGAARSASRRRGVASWATSPRRAGSRRGPRRAGARSRTWGRSPAPWKTRLSFSPSWPDPTGAIRRPCLRTAATTGSGSRTAWPDSASRIAPIWGWRRSSRRSPPPWKRRPGRSSGWARAWPRSSTRESRRSCRRTAHATWPSSPSSWRG